MNDPEIKEIVRETLREQRAHYASNTDEAVLRTVAAILTSFGLDDDDRKELKADFIHLRKWRKSVETIERTGWVTAITIIVTGVLGALWIGIKAILGK